MLDIVKHITIGDKEYPMAYTLNVMEDIQERFGTIEEWGNVMQPTKEITDEETGETKVVRLEPQVKNIKWTFTQFINEGIDIENEEKTEKRPFVTEKQVGRLISAIGMNKVNEELMAVTVASTKTLETDEEKNE